MASRQTTVDFLLEQLENRHCISTKKMFGEYAIYYNQKIVAFVCDDQLFVKPTMEGKDFIGDYVEGFPYPGAKPHLLISGDLWEDSEWLSELIRLTASALPDKK